MKRVSSTVCSVCCSSVIANNNVIINSVAEQANGILYWSEIQKTGCFVNSFKSGVPFVGHRQTV